ncbi:MAG: spermidine synthase, partial [Gammaproteobacteria bacterium]
MSSSHRILILLAFAVSGCAGLIYESVWSHYLGLYLGHAAFAQTLTLGIFMGGMTIGALAISRYTYKIKNALTAYAIAELILGVLGLLFHSIFVEFIAFSYDSVFPNLNSSSLIEIYKWFSASLIILPQSIVLGATFPLLCSALIRREQQGTGRHISMLYFSNSIGAAAGALIATFVLLPLVGMPGALLTSGLINISVAILAYYLAKQPEQKSSAVQKDKPAETTTASYIVLVAALITGAVSFMYEIAWIRMLNLILGTSLHAFEIMLSAFILGLALGGWWIKNRIDQIQNLLRFNGIVQICMGLAAISTLSLYVQSFDWVSTLLKETLRLTDTGYIFYNITTSIISGLIMIPATFCAGMTLPLLTTHLIRTSKSESAIGRVYASNTIGAIIGIVFAVHIGMTVLGLKWLIITAGLIDIALGVYLIAYAQKPTIRFPISTKFIVLCLAGLATFSLFTEFLPSRLASGTFRYGRVEAPNIEYYQDGKTATVGVQINENGVGIISTNGKPDAGLRLDLRSEDPVEVVSDEITMAMLAAMPLLVKPDLKEVAAIGFGSGMTSHIVLTSPSVKVLDSIEIEPAMVEGAKLFKTRNNLAFDDPRSKIHFDDAKTFFAAQQKKYDVIISEPSNPWVIGVGNLFTKEFYSLMKRYLKDDGLLVQWLHLYEISTATLLTALSALDSEFQHYDLYTSVKGDIIIVASTRKSTDLSIKPSW